MINFFDSIFSIRFVIKRKLKIEKYQNLILSKIQFIFVSNNFIHDRFNEIFHDKSTFRKFSLKKRLMSFSFEISSRTK